jgi:hypothetical protein
LSYYLSVMIENNDWKHFDVYEGIKAKALIVDGAIEKVVLITKVPRGHYYSFLNEAIGEAEKLFINETLQDRV